MADKTKLDELREQINRTDRELIRLFEQRMDIARAVGDYKRERGLPVFVAEREAEVIRSRREWLENPAYADAAEELFECIMGLSRKLQHQTVPAPEIPAADPVEDPKAAYCGVPGCYAEEALKKYFGAEAETVSVTSFAQVFETLRSGKADYGVVPVENTSTGAIDDVLDLLAPGGLYIVGQTVIEINHCLLGVPGAALSDVREVYSHPQGLAQSREFLNTLPGVKQIPAYNTAAAAKYVSEEGDRSKAAVASRYAGKLYGLEPLAESVNSLDNNHTRFVVIGRRFEIAEDADTVSIAFTLPHKSGTLRRVISQFAAAGMNLLHIESRPLAERNFEYLFFIDFSGNMRNPAVTDALEKVRSECLTLHVLGNYRAK